MPKRKWLFYSLTILLIIFAGIRHNGFDWINYNTIFEGIKNKTENFSGTTFIEYGFQYLTLLSPNYRCLVFLSAAISIWMTLSAIYKLSTNSLPILGLLIFYTTFCMPTYMGQIRQGIAMGFVIWAYWYLWTGRKVPCFWLIIAGSMFHMTALIALFVFLPIKREYSIKVYIVGLAGAFIASKLALQIVGIILRMTSSSMGDKILYYAMTENEELGISSTILIRIVTLLLVVYLNQGSNKQISFLSNIYFIGIALYLLLGFAPQLAGRGTYYFSIMEMILVPYIAKCLIRNRAIYITAYFGIIGLSVYRFMAFFSNSYNYSCYIPYFPI